MNFFGHAWVAARADITPGFVLGAMLPDFMAISRTKPLRVLGPEVAAGVALHHETDARFHAAPTFVSLCQDAVTELREAGVHRGGARAAAHVGVELALDGWLLDDGSANDAYLGALTFDYAAFDHAAGHPAIEWADDDDGRFRAFRARLRGHGLPHGYRDGDFVAARIRDALRHRPRLCLSEEDQRSVARWAAGLLVVMPERAPALLREIGH